MLPQYQGSEVAIFAASFFCAMPSMAASFFCATAFESNPDHSRELRIAWMTRIGSTDFYGAWPPEPTGSCGRSTIKMDNMGRMGSSWGALLIIPCFLFRFSCLKSMI